MQDAKPERQPEPATEQHFLQLRGSRPVKIPGTSIVIKGAPQNGWPWVIVEVPLLTNDAETE